MALTQRSWQKLQRWKLDGRQAFLGAPDTDYRLIMSAYRQKFCPVLIPSEEGTAPDPEHRWRRRHKVPRPGPVQTALAKRLATAPLSELCLSLWCAREAPCHDHRCTPAREVRLWALTHLASESGGVRRRRQRRLCVGARQPARAAVLAAVPIGLGADGLLAGQRHLKLG